MCGICGAVQVSGALREPLPADVLARMTDALVHRGPDERGTYLAPGVALGVRRLAIVDPRAGQQPVSSEDGEIVAVQNGELYNHLDLRRELSGHRFRSACDTEVLPHLYEHCGAALPGRLRGKFALAVWDGRARRLLLARDRLGVKPLYYARVGELLLFSSELKSLLASGLVPTDLDYEAIDAYLSLAYVPAPATPLAAVRKLEPGELLLAGPHEGVRRERYWHYPLPEPDSPARPEGEYAEELLELLDESVRLRLMSDVPLGAMLSGGLDSSLIVALMARNASGPVKTFSVGFREAGPANELGDARRVAELYGCEHHELELSYAEQSVDLADLVWSMDEPLASLSSLGFLALSQLASKHVTVALSGQGADELLGGYERYRTAALAARVRRLPAAGRALGLAARGGRFARPAAVVAAEGAAAQWYAAHARLDDTARARFARRPLAGLDGGRRAGERAAAGLRVDGLPGMLYLDARLVLPDDMLHYFDRASMAHSLEVRVPFLDHELVEWCARVPAELKVRGLTTKYLLKRAARGLVPDEIIGKRKIGFFHGAAGGWLQTQLSGAISDYLLGPDPRYAELLERSEVEQLIARHRAGGGGSEPLLAILMLEIWLSTYLPRAAQSAAAPVAALV
jgi:asparagine synthase (glutamine-hydrolysing)